MAMINKKIALSIFACLLACFSYAQQVRFIANPIAIGRNADALMSIKAVSSYIGSVEGEIRITVTEENSGKSVLSLVFSKIQVLPGNNLLSHFRSRVNRLFYDNELSIVARNTGSFAPANYAICCEFIPEDKMLPPSNEHCFFSSIMPRTPIILIEPVDSICHLRPPFIWQGRKTADKSVAFKVVCVEIKDGQTPEEAMQNNFPLISEPIFRQANQLSFPMGSPQLKEGKKYAWQVSELSGLDVFNSSEIATFSVGCSEPEIIGIESFAEVKSFYTGKIYYYSSTINFSLVNPYTPGVLKYSIVHVPSLKKLKNLPELKMTSGLNKFVLKTDGIKGLIKGEPYKIEVYNLGNAVHYINFMIKDE